MTTTQNNDTAKDKLAQLYVEEAILTDKEKEVIDKALKSITYDDLHTIYEIMKRRYCMDDIITSIDMELKNKISNNEIQIEANYVNRVLSKHDDYAEIYWDTINAAVNHMSSGR